MRRPEKRKTVRRKTAGANSTKKSERRTLKGMKFYAKSIMYNNKKENRKNKAMKQWVQ